MKKILRLVTTSVLTLTLVACGEASSSVSTSGTQTSSSVSSGTSAFANVSTITLSAASDTLTQTLGTQKAVVVKADLNANTNPTQALEWFVNGTKSNQTGRVFEYTPAAAGTFVISARVGSVLSNNITLTVGAPVFAITGDIKVVDGNSIEITAPGGATVAVTNNTVQPESFYDITKGVYVIELKTALKQGDTATVTLTKDGFAPLSKLFTFDTRKLELDKVTADGDDEKAVLVGTSYEIERPFILGSNGRINETPRVVKITFKSENMATASGAFSQFKLERTAAPSGAEVFVTQEGQVVVSSADAGSKFVEFELDQDSALGLYEFTYTLGGVSRKVSVQVVQPKAEIELVEQGTGKHDVTFTQSSSVATEDGVVTGLTATGGVFEITKDYLLSNDGSGPETGSFKTFTFTAFADNVSVPTNLLGTIQSPIGTTPNVLNVSLVGPNGLATMRFDGSQTAFPPQIAFRNTVTAANGLVVNQKVDSTTPVGDYVYTIRVNQLGTELLTKTVTVRIKDPAPKLTMTATVTDSSNLVWNNVPKLLTVNIDTDQGNQAGNLIFAGRSVTAAELEAPTAANVNEVVRITTGGTIADKSSATGAQAEASVIAGRLYINTLSSSNYVWTLVAPGATTDTLALGDYFYDIPNNQLFKTAALVSTNAGNWGTALTKAEITTELDTSGDFDTLAGEFFLSANGVLMSATTESISAHTKVSHILLSETKIVMTKGSDNIFTDLTAAVGDNDFVWFGAFPKTTVLGIYLEGADLEDATVTTETFPATEANLGDYIFVGPTSITTAGIKIFQSVVDDATADPVTYKWNEVNVAPKDSFVIEVDSSDVITTYKVSANTSGALTLVANTTAEQNILYTKSAAKDEHVLFAYDGSVWAEGLGSVATPLRLESILKNGDDAEPLHHYSTKLINTRNFANSNVEGQVHGNLTTGSLQYSTLAAETVELKETTAGVYTISRPLRSSTDALSVRFTAVLENYQSPLNQTADLKNSFAASANLAGAAGPREFVDFVKEYTGPMTLANIAANTAKEKVAVQVGTANAFAADGVNDRFSSAPETYDLYTTNRTKLTLADAFVLNVDFASLNGDYTFKLQLGPNSQTVVVRVQDSAPKINVLVYDKLADRMLTPTATNQYEVNLNSVDEADLNLNVDLVNLQPSSGSTLAFTLERNYSFDETVWSNTITDVLTIENKLGNNGTVVSTVPAGQAEPTLSTILQTSEPNGVANLLELTAPGTYTYKLTIGSTTHSWSVVAKEFPKVAIAAAYLGTTTAAGTTALTIFNKNQPIIPLQTTAAAGNARLWLDVTPVNLVKGVHYYQLTTTTITRAPNIGGLTATQLGLVTLNFTTATTAKVAINPTSTFALLDESAAITNSNFTAEYEAKARLWIYNSSKVAVGYVDVAFRVVDTEVDPEA